ncbi:hypothetical protein IFM89_019214 [Coptis chinensis]|uniref:Uncharacterized protein n=1 Tax=Coptis chinensis TaxID=261450 RepID=A0A835IWJ9_9MAGN|nr:hypothetical protein IFM89_019214 [Coptis chinensis]
MKQLAAQQSSTKRLQILDYILSIFDSQQQQQQQWTMSGGGAQQAATSSVPPTSNYNHHNYQPTTLEEIRTLWIGDLQYWVEENYLNTCFAHTGEHRMLRIIYYGRLFELKIRLLEVLRPMRISLYSKEGYLVSKESDNLDRKVRILFLRKKRYYYYSGVYVVLNIGVIGAKFSLENATYPTPLFGIKGGVAISGHDGHWPGDYGGPMFLMLGLAISEYKVKAGHVQNIRKSEPPIELLPKARPSSTLPADFFDTNETKRQQTGLGTGEKIGTDTLKGSVKSLDAVSSEMVHGKSKEDAHTKMDVVGSEVKQVKGALPEGFFDNKDADQRAHGIENYA